MTSTEPDPARTSRAARPQISIEWTSAAKHEYSSREAAPTRAALNALVRRAARQTLQHAPLKLPLPTTLPQNEIVFSMDVSLVSDAEIQELNAEHRGKNKPTDVLSFSQLEGDELPFDVFPQATAEVLLGDVIISIETATRQAQELKHSLEHEIAFLTAHGVLHLCGYDHDTSSRRRTMWKKQDEVVRLLGLE